MSEKPRSEEALRELRLLTTCRCAPDWTDRDLHETHCVAYYREEVDSVASELDRLRTIVDAARRTLNLTTYSAAREERAALRAAFEVLDGDR